MANLAEILRRSCEQWFFSGEISPIFDKEIGKFFEILVFVL
jgi:hypothetical protein